MSASQTPRLVWITGASSGIGHALALSFARDGATVAVTARSADKLRALAALSPNIKAFPCDVTDAAGVAAAVSDIERAHGAIDLAILNAGIWHLMAASRYDLAKATESMNVNYTGVTNALAPVMAAMIARRAGHIAMVASVAGFRGLPQASAYAPTKAALINLAECLYGDLKRHGVRMTIINPGFVATPMTDVNKFPMPFIISAEEAVTAIRRGLARDRFEIVFPGRMALAMKTFRVLPYRLFFWVTNNMPKR